MSKSKSPADFSVHVTTYQQLRQHAQAFAAGHLNLLLIRGSPGVGKSQCVREAVGDRVCWLSGNVTAFRMYQELFIHCDQPVVLDDVDEMYRDRQAIRLLKSVCQTDPIKHVSWQSATPILDREGIAREFVTSSRVAIIANQWEALDAHVAALEDRGHVIDFEPTALEVHRNVAEWFWDQEVFDFVGQHLHLMKSPSMRTYVLAREKKEAGLDWKEFVLSRCLSGPALEVAKLLADPALSKGERLKAFVDAGHGSRSTFFNHCRKLQVPDVMPVIRLAKTCPPLSPPARSNHLDLLRDRYGQLGYG